MMFPTLDYCINPPYLCLVTGSYYQEEKKAIAIGLLVSSRYSDKCMLRAIQVYNMMHKNISVKEKINKVTM